MKKTLKKLTALVLSLVMVLGCIPSFTNEVSAEAIDASFKLTLAREDVWTSKAVNSIFIAKDKCALEAWANGGEHKTVTTEPTLLGFTTSPKGEILGSNSSLAPGKKYYMQVKYDLTGCFGDGEESILLGKTNPSTWIHGESKIINESAELVVDKTTRSGCISVSNFTFTADEKSVTFAVECNPTINPAIHSVNLDNVLHYDANRITFEVSGRELPDYAELSVYKGDLSSLTSLNIQAQHNDDHYMDLYSYNTADIDYLNPTHVGYTNYGNNSVSADRTKAVYTFITEDVGPKFVAGQEYTFLFTSELGKWTNRWILSPNKFHDSALEFTTEAKPVLNITYKNDFSDGKIATTSNKFMSDSSVISTATEDYIDIFDVYFSRDFALEGQKYRDLYYPGDFTNYSRAYVEPIKLELQTDKHLTDYQIYLNGREVKYIDDIETVSTLETDLPVLKDCIDNSKPFIYEEDGNYWLYIVANMLISQQPKKENDYKVIVNSLNTSDYYALGYRWQRKSVDDNYKIPNDKGIMNQLVVGRDDSPSPKPAYTDADNNYLLCTLGVADNITYTQIQSVGLQGIKTSDSPLTYESTIVLKTTGTNNRKFIPGDKLVFKSPKVSDKVDKIQMTVRGTHDTFQWGNCENVYSYYEYTLQSKDIDEINNTVTIDIKSVYNEHYNTQYGITSCQITSNGVIWTDIPNDISNTLRTRNVGETYRCNIFVGNRELDTVFSNEVTIEEEPEPAPTGGSSSYKAVDKDKTTEKITGTGRKGAKRVIIPKEGRKVQSVIVTDKKGNQIEVTPEKDGTYSFIQPGSDVDVKVNYKLRLIELTIGSLDASVDDVHHTLDVVPQVRNDRTMLPIRFVAENLGAKVDWAENDPDTVWITRGDIKIEITLGSDIAKVNGKEYKLDAIAFAENDRTYLPVRFVSEHLNAIVEWNEARPMEVKIYER